MISFTNHLEREFKPSVLCKSNKNQMHDFRSLFLRSFLESANSRLIAVFKRHSEIVRDCLPVFESPRSNWSCNEHERFQTSI